MMEYNNLNINFKNKDLHSESKPIRDSKISNVVVVEICLFAPFFINVSTIVFILLAYEAHFVHMLKSFTLRRKLGSLSRVQVDC